jgi:uncharacterized protein (DUF433 family)
VEIHRPGDRIVTTPGVRGGKPRIAGHRITVSDVAIWHERIGMSPDEIVSEYPSITLSDVHAALAYYFDHRDEVDREILEGEEFAEKLRAGAPSIFEELERLPVGWRTRGPPHPAFGRPLPKGRGGRTPPSPRGEKVPEGRMRGRLHVSLRRVRKPTVRRSRVTEGQCRGRFAFILMRTAHTPSPRGFAAAVST